MSPAFTYKIPLLANTGWQAISSADRPLCAAVSALAYLQLPDTHLGGMGRLLTRDEGRDALLTFLEEENIDAERAKQWAFSVAYPERTCIVPPTTPMVIDGLTVSDYQRLVISGTSKWGMVLNLGCGLGKTLTTAAILLALADDPSIKTTRCWIICPLNAFGAWQRFVPALKARYTDVQIISMDSTHKLIGCANVGGVVVFDEAHLMGEPKARRTASAHLVRRMFDSAFCLTGTMNHGGIHKSLSMMDLACPGAAWFSSRWRCGEYFRCLVKKQLGARSVTGLVRPVGICRELFFQFLASRTLALTKHSEVVRREVQFPDQHMHMIEVGDCSRGLNELAAEYVRTYIIEHGEIPEASKVAHALSAQGVPEKLARLMEEVGDDPDDHEPMAIFAAYTETMDKTEEWLKFHGLTYVRVDGNITGPDRIEAQRKFQGGEVRVFLGQQHAAAISMDLFAACVSIALDRNWSAADYSQMLARTCRRGQTKECHHIDFVTNRFQIDVLKRLQAAEDFDAQCVEYQDIIRASKTGGIYA